MTQPPPKKFITMFNGSTIQIHNADDIDPLVGEPSTEPDQHGPFESVDLDPFRTRPANIIDFPKKDHNG